MTSVATLIHAVVQRDTDTFRERMEATSLEAAVDVWLKRVARRKLTSAQRTRLIRSVARATALETKDIQLTRAALLRAAGLDERAAAAAAVAAGATYTELGEILGMSQQGASQRVRPYLRGDQPAVAGQPS
jgi:hypothetical protein